MSLLVLKMACFFGKLQKKNFSRIAMVSGLWAPPGPRLGGHNYADFNTIFEMRSFWKKVAKKKHFKNRIGIKYKT